MKGASSSSDYVVEFRGVTLIQGKDALDLALKPGELAAIEFQNGTSIRRLADHTVGFGDLENGKVF